MFSSPISKSDLVKTSLFSLLMLFILFFKDYHENSFSKVVFCDVGQADGAYVRARGGVDIIVDAGVGSEMAECLGRHMPLWDRTIEVAFITHPQKDHYGGLEHILSHYRVKMVVMTPVDSPAESFQSLVKRLATLEDRTQVVYLYSPDVLTIGSDVKVRMWWPHRESIHTHLQDRRAPYSTNAVLGLHESSTDPNYFSQIFTLSLSDFDILFTGDTTPEVLARISSSIGKPHTSDGVIEVLKVPHHGSINGLIPDLLTATKPLISVISAGKNNTFGHPRPEIMAMLEKSASLIYQTAHVGDVIFQVDPQGEWWIVRRHGIFSTQRARLRQQIPVQK